MSYIYIYIYMCVCVCVCVCVYVCVFVRLRARARMCACVRKRKRVRNLILKCGLCVNPGEQTKLSILNRLIFFLKFVDVSQVLTYFTAVTTNERCEKVKRHRP